MRFQQFYLTESSKSLSFKLSSKFNTALEFKIHKNQFEITKLEMPESEIKKGTGIQVFMEIFNFCDKKHLDVILGEIEETAQTLNLNKSIKGVYIIAALILAQKPKLELPQNWPTLPRYGTPL